jgi:hypothetical protein
MVDSSTSLPVAAGEGLVNNQPFGGNEITETILVEVSNETINQHPLVLFGRDVIRFGFRLHGESNNNTNVVNSLT